MAYVSSLQFSKRSDFLGPCCQGHVALAGQLACEGARRLPALTTAAEQTFRAKRSLQHGPLGRQSTSLDIDSQAASRSSCVKMGPSRNTISTYPALDIGHQSASGCLPCRVGTQGGGSASLCARATGRDN